MELQRDGVVIYDELVRIRLETGASKEQWVTETEDLKLLAEYVVKLLDREPLTWPEDKEIPDDFTVLQEEDLFKITKGVLPKVLYNLYVNPTLDFDIVDEHDDCYDLANILFLSGCIAGLEAYKKKIAYTYMSYRTRNVLLALVNGNPDSAEYLLEFITRDFYLTVMEHRIADAIDHNCFMNKLDVLRNEAEEYPNSVSLKLADLCTSVLVHEAVRNPSTLSKLAKLPDELLKTVLWEIAHNTLGYSVLVQLKQNATVAPKIEGHMIQMASERGESFLSLLHKKDFPKWLRNYLLRAAPVPLLDIFGNYELFKLQETQFDDYIWLLRDKASVIPPSAIGSPSVVPKDTFRKQFNDFTHGVFEGFDFSNTIVVGGSVLASLLPNLQKEEHAVKSDSPFNDSDIDVYFYGLTLEQFQSKMQYLHQHLVQFQNKMEPKRKLGVLQSSHAYYFCLLYPYRTIQVVIGEFASIEHVLTGCDIDCSAVGYNGDTVFTFPRGMMALNHRWNVPDERLVGIRGSPNYEVRLMKYSKRGFGIYSNLKGVELDDFTEYSFTKNRFDTDCLSIYGVGLLLLANTWPELVDTFINYKAGATNIPYKINATEFQQFLRDISYWRFDGYTEDESVPAPMITDSPVVSYFPEVNEENGSYWWHGVTTTTNAFDASQYEIKKPWAMVEQIVIARKPKK